MSSVLISFAKEDEAFAQRLHADLRKADLQIVADNPEIALAEIVATTSSIVLVTSPASIVDERVQHIIDFARDHELQLYPVMHRFTPMPDGLALVMPLDMSTETRYDNLLPGLVELLQNGTDLEAVLFPDWLTIEDSRHWVGADLQHYMGILTLIARPRAGQSGDAPTPPYRNDVLDWYHHAAIVPAIAADGVESTFIARVTPPTAERLHEQLQAPYRIVCISCGNQDEALLFEDEWEREAPLYPQHLVNMFADSPAELLILQAELPENDAEILLEESNLNVLLLVNPELDTATFTHLLKFFYTRLRAGQSISTALYTSIEQSEVDGAGFKLLFKPGLEEARITVPNETKAAHWSLIDDGLPAMFNTSVNVGFVGRRDSLDELAREIASSDYRQIAIYGDHESGKSWMAAEYIAQHGWRYPDGVVWLRITEQSKSEDVIGQLLAVLELPSTTNWNTVRELLRERSVLIVLDQLDEWGDPLEIGELADFIARLDTVGGSRILLTSWGPVQPITYTSGTEENQIHPLTIDEARRLTAQYVTRYDIKNVLSEDNAINAFAAVTQHEPWLIREAIQLVERHGLSDALAAIKDLTEDVADPFEAHMLKQLDLLEPHEIDVVRRLQGLKDGVSLELVQELVPIIETPVLRRLLKLDMLRREGTLYRVPKIVQLYLRQYLPLNDAEQDEIDNIVIQFMLRGTL